MSALLSPSTVLIKASGGRQQGWMDGLREGGEICMYGCLIYVMEGRGAGVRLNGAES